MSSPRDPRSVDTRTGGGAVVEKVNRQLAVPLLQSAMIQPCGEPLLFQELINPFRTLPMIHKHNRAPVGEGTQQVGKRLEFITQRSVDTHQPAGGYAPHGW